MNRYVDLYTNGAPARFANRSSRVSDIIRGVVNWRTTLFDGFAVSIVALALRRATGQAARVWGGDRAAEEGADGAKRRAAGGEAVAEGGAGGQGGGGGGGGGAAGEASGGGGGQLGAKEQGGGAGARPRRRKGGAGAAAGAGACFALCVTVSRNRHSPVPLSASLPLLAQEDPGRGAMGVVCVLAVVGTGGPVKRSHKSHIIHSPVPVRGGWVVRRSHPDSRLKP
eukprot:1195966-Prorocentrum_minimum.AAC.7